MHENILKYFKVKNIYAHTKEFIATDIKTANEVKSKMPAYFVVGLPFNTTNKYRDSIMSFFNLTIFKILDYTPMKLTGGIITAAKLIPPSITLETMDGRTLEGFQRCNLPDATGIEASLERPGLCLDFYKYNSRTVHSECIVASEALLTEVQKNFIHPHLNLDNFMKYSYRKRYTEYNEYPYVHSVFEICDKITTSQKFSQWNQDKDSLYKILESRFHEEDFLNKKANDTAAKHAEEQKRNMDDLDKAFGKKANASAQPHSIHLCPACATKCRVPSSGKQLSIRCPKCGKEFIVCS